MNTVLVSKDMFLGPNFPQKLPVQSEVLLPWWCLVLALRECPYIECPYKEKILIIMHSCCESIATLGSLSTAFKRKLSEPLVYSTLPSIGSCFPCQLIRHLLQSFHKLINAVDGRCIKKNLALSEGILAL